MILRIRCGYIGVAIIVCAIFVRLIAGGSFLDETQVASLLTYFYTGKTVTLTPPETKPPQETQAPTEGTDPTIPQEREDPLQISLQAGLSVQYRNETACEIPLTELLKAPLDWHLTGDKPCVLIVHTHATESYKNTGQYTESDPYRTTEEAHNMLAVGDRLAAFLTAGGISVIHDRTLHDYPTYSVAYNRARETIQRYLDQNKNICLVLDIHRDAVADGNGNQLGMTTVHNGKKMAQLGIVVGTDTGGQYHPNWKKNAALAVKLQTVLEGEFSGICRPVIFRSSRYNQDLSDGALIVEVGAAGNTMEEALTGAELLARAIIKLAHGAVTVDN